MVEVDTAVTRSYDRGDPPLVTDGGYASVAPGATVPSLFPGGDLSLSTEQAVTIFGALAGVGGFLAQVLAARKLAQVEGDTIQVSSLLVPTVILSLGVLFGAAFIPSG